LVRERRRGTGRKGRGEGGKGEEGKKRHTGGRGGK